MDTSIELLPGLTLADPIMVASSHWTSTESQFKKWALLQPASLTLKTTSERKGGSGKVVAAGNRKMRRLRSTRAYEFARYTDGPPKLELWDLATSHDMTDIARRTLPRTVLGLSVLQGEDYPTIKASLNMESYGYVELNLKYTYRGKPEANEPELTKINEDIGKFIDTFAPTPVLVKLPREALPHLDQPLMEELFDDLCERNAGLIVANSKRIRVPASRVDGAKPQELSSGVVVGEYLFLETYDAIVRVHSRHPNLVLVASGGIVDYGSCVDVLAAGASAIQLCSAMDQWGVHFLEWIRAQLIKSSEGFGSFEAFRKEVLRSTELQQAVICESRKFELDIVRVVEDGLSARQSVEHFEESLRIEVGEPEFSSAAEEPVALSGDLVCSLGNGLSCLLGKGLGARLGLDVRRYEALGDFRSDVIQKKLGYKMALVTASCLKDLEDESLEGLAPRVICVTGRSRIELVGNTGHKLEEISDVYHFGGTTSRSVVPELMRDLTGAPATHRISSRDLLPLLRCWSSSSAILAKPPLSRMYQALYAGDPAVWGPLWYRDEDLYLVVAAAFHDVLEEGVLNGVKQVAGEVVATIAQDPERAAWQLARDGFLRHCLDYLNARGVSLS